LRAGFVKLCLIWCMSIDLMPSSASSYFTFHVGAYLLLFSSFWV